MIKGSEVIKDLAQKRARKELKVMLAIVATSTILFMVLFPLVLTILFEKVGDGVMMIPAAAVITMFVFFLFYKLMTSK